MDQNQSLQSNQPTSPQSFQQPVAPTAQVAYLTPEQAAAVQRSNKKKLLWGLVCLIGPTALIVIAILGYAIANFVAGSVAPTAEGELLPQPSAGSTIVNVFLFLVGAVFALTWLPGIIIGTVLLAKRQ